MSAPEAARAAARLPIAILISGRGSNMRAIAERAADGSLPIDIRVVVSDQANAGRPRDRTRVWGCVREVLSPRHIPRPRELRSARWRRWSPATRTDSVILRAGFMRILTPEFIAPFAGRIVNIHPSLLPKCRGLHTHRRALGSL